jgi:hypothetical protein
VLIVLLLLLLMQMTMMRGQLLQGAVIRRVLLRVCRITCSDSPSHAPAGRSTPPRVCGSGAVLLHPMAIVISSVTA